MDDYQKEHTEKFEGIYTAEEIELNNKLYEECSKEEIDFGAVEELLKNGADPLGGTAVTGWGLLEHVYEEIVCDSQESQSVNLPKITELFIKYGMDVGNPKVPYDGDNSINPLWSFSFVPNENSIVALKMLLDNGLNEKDAAEFWYHSIFDAINIDRYDPNDKECNEYYTWTMKMIMLVASYDRILNKDEDLARIINLSINTYDVQNFKNWNNFYYKFDTSRCERYPEFCRSVIKIYDVETNREVWKIGVCLNEDEF